MALITCPECGQTISDQAEKCPNCGYPITSKDNMNNTNEGIFSLKKKRHSKKKIFISLGIGAIVIICIGLFLFFLSPKTFPWLCKHKISIATCTEARTCSRCGKTWGEANGHQWNDATCTIAKRCRVCGATEGEPNGHSWKSATCTSPKTCKVCGATEGETIAHTWKSATCTSPKKCSVCGKTSGSSLGHNVVDYLCTRCGESVVTWNDVPNILDITHIGSTMSDLGEINQWITFKNKSSTKTIYYITIQMEYLDSNYNVLTDIITGNKSATLKYEGPLKPGCTSDSTYHWVDCFTNGSFANCINILNITIKYSDGTTIIFDEDTADNAVVDWR